MVYLDAAASTSPNQSVTDCFLKTSAAFFANPSSTHGLGREAGRKLEEQRRELLSLLGVSKTHQAIFLSGATEANNLAIKGAALCYQNRGKKILYSATEHPSVISPCRYLADAFCFEAVAIPVDHNGVVNPQKLAEMMDKDVVLVSIMGVNNETGAVNDLASLAEIVHAYPKAFFHSDLTQAIGKTNVPFSCLDLFSFSGHKIHGIKGSGALVYRNSMRFVPSLHGGGQEFGFRSSTVSLPLAASFVAAVRESLSHQETALAHALALKETLLGLLPMDEVTLNSSPEGSPFVVNFSLKRHKASVIVEGLSQQGIYVSSSSACSSKTDHPSDVLLAMGRSVDAAANAIRVSFEESTSIDDVRSFALALTKLLKEVHPR